MSRARRVEARSGERSVPARKAADNVVRSDGGGRACSAREAGLEGEADGQAGGEAGGESCGAHLSWRSVFRCERRAVNG